MSTAPSTPPPTTVSFASTTPNTTPGATVSPSSSPKPKEKWTTRVGTLVKRRSTSRRSSLSLANNTTPGDVSDSASEKEKPSLVDNLVRKASRRLSFSRTSTTESIPANPKKKPSIDLQRSVTVDVDLPTTTSTSSLSLEPAHQINGGAKHASSAMLAVDVPSPIAESPLREADVVMRDTLAGAEGSRAAGGRFISMSSMKPQIDNPPAVPASADAEPQAEEKIKETEKEPELEPVEPVQVPIIAIQTDEPITPPTLPIPPIVPYAASAEEETEKLQPLDNDAADQDLEESMVIVDHPVEEEEIAPEPLPAVVETVVQPPVPASVSVEVLEFEKPAATPVTPHPEPVVVAQSSAPPQTAPEQSSSELKPVTPIAATPLPIAEKSAPFPKSSPSAPRARSPSPSPAAPQSWSAVKIGSSIIAASVAIALGAYALVRTGVVPSSLLPQWFGSSTSTSVPGASVTASSSSSGLSKFIPDLSFLSAFPFSLSLGWSSSPPAGQDERGWAADGMLIAADAASLVVDAAVDSVSAGAVGSGMGGGVSTGGAVAGTGVLAVVGAGLAKFGSIFWAPWRAQRRGS
ncbi:hypothetical protein BJ165DRAFT_744523 [Panaeolus papilionaceus]|nr:hypothetical protein BJ165DRAFT_744523 [Panaeolus papilionaceus]